MAVIKITINTEKATNVVIKETNEKQEGIVNKISGLLNREGRNYKYEKCNIKNC